MARRKKPKVALDEILESYVPPQTRNGYLAKVSDEVREFITRSVLRFKDGELRDKFKSYSRLGEWLYETLKKERPEGFPEISMKHFTEVIRTIKKTDAG
jgi:hypothetical protein